MDWMLELVQCPNGHLRHNDIKENTPAQDNKDSRFICFWQERGVMSTHIWRF